MVCVTECAWEKDKAREERFAECPDPRHTAKTLFAVFPDPVHTANLVFAVCPGQAHGKQV